MKIMVDKPLDLKAQVEKDRMTRQTKCQGELVALLAKYNCDLVPSLTLQGTQFNWTLAIVAKV